MSFIDDIKMGKNLFSKNVLQGFPNINLKKLMILYIEATVSNF